MCSTGAPLLTCAVLSFNQRAFVKEAVEAAFAQTYSPLEIILSDDCSADGSFEIMEQLASRYTGPHRLVLHQTKSQVGIAGHLNAIAKLASGALIVIAAADDVSLPERVAEVCAAWVATGQSATSIHSDYIQIDERGSLIPRVFAGSQGYSLDGAPYVDEKVDPWLYVTSRKPSIFGCTHSVSPSIFWKFGDLPGAVIHEDDVLGFRSILAASVLYIRRPLVKYRLHGSNLYLARHQWARSVRELRVQEDLIRRSVRNRLVSYEAFSADLATALHLGLVSEESYVRTARQLESRLKQYRLMRDFLSADFPLKCSILPKILGLRLDSGERNLVLKRMMPEALFLRLRMLRSYLARL